MSDLRPVVKLQPNAVVAPKETVTRPDDGNEQTRYTFGRGRWRSVPMDRKSLQRQADKIDEHLGYILAHLATMADAYKGQADDHYRAILVTIALYEFVRDEWANVKGSL